MTTKPTRDTYQNSPIFRSVSPNSSRYTQRDADVRGASELTSIIRYPTKCSVFLHIAFRHCSLNVHRCEVPVQYLFSLSPLIQHSSFHQSSVVTLCSFLSDKLLSQRRPLLNAPDLENDNFKKISHTGMLSVNLKQSCAAKLMRSPYMHCSCYVDSIFAPIQIVFYLYPI